MNIKAIVIALLFSYSPTYALSVKYQFQCETDQKIKAGATKPVQHFFSFTLKQNDKSFYLLPAASEEESAFQVTPHKSQLYVFGIEDVSNLEKSKNSLRFSGSDIDIVIGELELYDDSHWTSGWVRTRNTSDPKDKGSYSSVSCIVRTL